MNEHEELIKRFYTSFRDKDYRAMQECYHAEIIFSDPVFQNLMGNKAKAMWHMLTSRASDLKIMHSHIKSSGNNGSCHWEAWYPFSVTGRKVHNIIDATFEFRDGKIWRHTDHFDFWRWSRMALGMPGIFLGWTPMVKSQVRKRAAGNLEKFIQSHQEYA